MSDKTKLTDAFWLGYASQAGMAASDYVACSFGDSPALANELAALVIAGSKRATASLEQDYADDLPKVGDHVVVVDADGTPCCIWRTSEITIKPLIEVTADFAWDEGEGDRSVDYWLAAHRAYFSAQAAAQGFPMHDRIATVFERFIIVWPLEIADQD